ncbi:MAG: SGNH/GDSL hydrolase family protein [Alphaproteobacteria bacterium]|nr:SGNH/GDSL hydrolase family protein [Alphaproteobacteria bacterium]
MAEARRPVVVRLLLGLVVATALMVSVEAALRLALGPPDVPLLIEGPKGGLFVERDGRLMPTQPDVLRTWPRSGAERSRPRLVVMGGSSMVVGEPGERAGEVAAARLDMEWVNLAMPGADTGHLVAMRPALTELKPDVVLIYSGHNDWGNAVFGGLYRDVATVRVAQVRGVLGRLRTYGLLEQALGARQIRTMPPERALDVQPLTATQQAAILDDQRYRLRRIVQQARAEGAQVVLSTVVRNDVFPSAWWYCPDRVAALGVEPVRDRVPDLSALDEAALATARSTSDCRDLDYLAALRDFEQGVPGAALRLRSLVESDPVPNRAPQAVNDAIRRMAAQEGATLADPDEALRGPDGIVPPRLFMDGMHLNGDGHHALAEVFVDAVERARADAPR